VRAIFKIFSEVELAQISHKVPNLSREAKTFPQ
jgi:hypothetical protein